MMRSILRYVAAAIMVTCVDPGFAGTIIVRVYHGASTDSLCAGVAADGWSAGGCDDDYDGIIVFQAPAEVQKTSETFAVCKDTIRWSSG